MEKDRIQKFLITLFLTGVVMSKPNITYHLSMPEPHTHYFHVEMTVENIRDSRLIVKMPVWTPGSYLVREFARNIPHVKAFTGRQDSELAVEKINKNSWRIETGGASTITVKYDVYAYEQSVRTSFLNISRGYVNGASVFLYADGRENEPGELQTKPYKSWRIISTGLSKTPGKSRTFSFDNYDILVDSPILMGNHKVIKFDALDKPHEIAVYGEGNMDEKQLTDDFKKIAEATGDLFGTLPYDRYVFILFLLEHGRGGLEHLNSTCMEIDRWIFTDEKKYQNFLTLVSHEFFHTWNVKRIRPFALGPFNYEEENYTEDLWIAEGITSYYEHKILLRGGIFNETDFFDNISKDIKKVETTPGRNVQSLTESSFDTWIKYYRSNENSPNTTISYYSKGSIVGLLLDLAIMESTNGEKSLDDVMRALYTDIYENEKRGFNSDEFRGLCEDAAGKSLDEIWQYVDGTEEIEYASFLSPFGYMIERSYSDEKSDSTAYFGIRTRVNNNRIKIRNVYNGTSAHESGLNVNDEIIAINDIRVDDGLLTKLMKESTIGENVEFLISREGEIRTIQIKPTSPPFDKYTLKKVDEAEDSQKILYQTWIQHPWEE
tara:strand:+ start:11763 stop:13577 length:1815 start_codon:yes stop_codon:yes gene_type:complete